MLKKEDGRIDWNQSALVIGAVCTRLCPMARRLYPFGNKLLKVHRAKVLR
jgi:methionyl-tRNA formyltransferase